MLGWKEQICWCIGNIAGDSDEYREVLVCNGCIKPVLDYLVFCVQKAQQTHQQPLHPDGHRGIGNIGLVTWLRFFQSNL
jgi:hypothetical protein